MSDKYDYILGGNEEEENEAERLNMQELHELQERQGDNEDKEEFTWAKGIIGKEIITVSFMEQDDCISVCNLLEKHGIDAHYFGLYHHLIWRK